MHTRRHADDTWLTCDLAKLCKPAWPFHERSQTCCSSMIMTSEAATAHQLIRPESRWYGIGPSIIHDLGDVMRSPPYASTLAVMLHLRHMP
jgi:hypothetical protein